MQTLEIGVISPTDWGLNSEIAEDDTIIEELGVSPRELEQRARACTVEWLQNHYCEEVGAYYGFYRAPERVFEPPQTTNLIAPWQMMAAYDRYKEDWMLERARSATEWFYQHFVISHPMAITRGGAKEGSHNEAWTKFTAEFALSCIGLFRRTGDAVWMERARQSVGFLVQARRHNFALRYDLNTEAWLPGGWQSWGRIVEALLILAKITEDVRWHEEALRWGNHGLSLQAVDGSYYLIDDDYYNTDIAAGELRALVFLHQVTGYPSFLEAAQRFAQWHLDRQLENGAWPMTIDRDGNVVVETIGPGDVPNIAIALLRLHAVTRDEAYFRAAMRAFRYSLSQQATPESNHPYLDDPCVLWGFWSWDPYYDYTLAGDQSTHHTRGMWFLLDYLAASHD